MDLPTTFMSAIVETVDGRKVTFPLLRVPDLAALAQDIKSDLLAAVERQLDAADLITRTKNPGADGITAVERYRARMEVEAQEFSTYAIIDRIKTPAGARRVLEVSLKKLDGPAAMTAEQIDAVLDALDLIETSNLALRVSRVVKPKPPAPAGNENADGGKYDVRPLDRPGDPKSETGSPTPPNSDAPGGILTA